MTPPSCSDWARELALDPVGTAGHYRGFLLVEQPLPWPADASEVPELAGVARLATAAGFRLQLLVPPSGPETSDGAAAPGGEQRRLVRYRQARDGWAGELGRSELVVAVADLLSAAEQLVEGRSPGARQPEARPTAVARGSQAAGEAAFADLLVCTHGRRDGCCGSLGSRLFSDLVDEPAIAPSRKLRVWRTSHTGGHRFAPTSVLFPSGTLWAYVDRALVERVLDATVPPSEVLPRYRGCATLGTPPQQALERAVFGEVGWGLLAAPRRAFDAGEALVRLETEGFGEWEAVVTVGRRVPQPACRTWPELATKHSFEWKVERLRQVG